MASATSVPFNPFGGRFESPGDHQRNRKSNRNEKDQRLQDPFGGVKRGQNGRTHLNNQPANDRVSDRHLVNVAPFQLGKEIALAHLKRAEYLRRQFRLQSFPGALRRT